MRAAFLVLATACSPSAAVVVHAPDGETAQEVEAGPLPVHVAKRGPIHVFVSKSREDLAGHAIWHTGCRRLVWAAHSSLVLHEIGHALGLGHVKTSGNLMYVAGGPPVLTERQLARAERAAAFLEACP